MPVDAVEVVAFADEAGDKSGQMLSLVVTIIREFYIDVLGGFVPGFVFTLFAVPFAVWTAFGLRYHDFAWRDIPWTKYEPIITAARPILIVLLLALSYVLGGVFSRRDPKVPDQLSAAYILRKDKEGAKRAVIREFPDPKVDNWFCRQISKRIPWFENFRKPLLIAKGLGGEFPYSHLRQYLETRGLKHLANHIPWSGEHKKLDYRSKMFINILKVRLQYFDQRKCLEIIRNEAHIRMMSSVWYAAVQLQHVYYVLLGFVAIGIATRYASWTSGLSATVWLLVALIGSAGWLRHSIVKFLHYQRVREIVYVLETAHVSQLAGNELIFKDLYSTEHDQDKSRECWDLLRRRRQFPQRRGTKTRTTLPRP